MNLKRFFGEFLEMLKYIVLLGLVSGITQNFLDRSPFVMFIQGLAILGVIYGGLHTENETWVENLFVICAIVLAFIPGTTGQFTPRAIPFVITMAGALIALAIRSSGKMDNYTSLKRFPILLSIAVLSVLF